MSTLLNSPLEAKCCTLLATAVLDRSDRVGPGESSRGRDATWRPSRGSNHSGSLSSIVDGLTDHQTDGDSARL